jgi:hypothetical protein
MKENRTPVSSHEVWQWPEWRAFADRLGVHERFMTYCSITLQIDQPAKIAAEYHGSKEKRQDETKTENSRFVTHEPT